MYSVDRGRLSTINCCDALCNICPKTAPWSGTTGQRQLLQWIQTDFGLAEGEPSYIQHLQWDKTNSTTRTWADSSMAECSIRKYGGKKKSHNVEKAQCKRVQLETRSTEHQIKNTELDRRKGVGTLPSTSSPVTCISTESRATTRSGNAGTAPLRKLKTANQGCIVTKINNTKPKRCN